MKILIVSANGFSKILNNGKTLESMFRCFVPSELCQLITRPQLQIDTDFCSSIYSVTEIDILRRFLGKSKNVGGELSITDIKEQIHIYDKRHRHNVKIPQIIRELIWQTNIWKTKKLKNWIKKENPDLIFLVGGGYKFLHSIGKFVAKLQTIPIALFYTDDYLIFPLKKGFLGKWSKMRMERDYKKIISKSIIRFAIGEMMCMNYSEYFGMKFYPIMNSAPKKNYSDNNLSQDTFTLSYFGGLHLNRWKMIARIAKLLPLNIRILVYTASDISKEIKNRFDQANVRIMGCVTGEELDKAIENSNILLHVESDEKNYRALTRLSVSTKIPEYLMAGRPIIGFGPQDVASMHVLSDNKVGISVDSELSDEQIKDILEIKLNDIPYLKALGKKAYNFAVNNFDGDKISQDFRKKLEETIYLK